MLNPKVLNFKTWTNPPPASQSQPVNYRAMWHLVTATPGHVSFCLSARAWSPQEKGGDSITPISEGVHGSSAHPNRLDEILRRLPRLSLLPRKKRQMTMGPASCKRPCAWGFISLISHASPWGKYFIRRKCEDHITVKYKDEVQNQFFPGPEHCLLDGRKTDLSLGLTLHAHIFYFGSGLKMHTSIILTWQSSF